MGKSSDVEGSSNGFKPRWLDSANSNGAPMKLVFTGSNGGVLMTSEGCRFTCGCVALSNTGSSMRSDTSSDATSKADVVFETCVGAPGWGSIFCIGGASIIGRVVSAMKRVPGALVASSSALISFAS